MDIILAGPGRAGMAVAIGLVRTGHRVAAVTGRGREKTADAARQLGSVPLTWAAPLPAADLLVLAVRDDAIAEAARDLAPGATALRAAVHLSGSVPVSHLGPFAAVGLSVGAFHPLQTLPDAETGAAALAGAFVALTASDPGLHGMLTGLAGDLGMAPFDLDDRVRPLYHAAAATASNSVVATLALAEQLFSTAGVPPVAARPLVRQVVDNFFNLGSAAALTGPVARGDVATVAAQVGAVRELRPDLLEGFLALVRLTAELAGRRGEMDPVIG